MEKKINYRVKHVGINAQNAEHAEELLKQFVYLFDLVPEKDDEHKVFAGDIIEIVKNAWRGTYGHIALQTEDVEAAMADLSSKGITFREETIRRDENGRITFIYLTQEFGGFAFHLTT